MSSLSAAAACGSRAAFAWALAPPAACSNTPARSRGNIRAMTLLRIDFIKNSLSVDSPLANGVGDSVDSQHIGRDTIVHTVGLSITDDVAEGGNHNLLQLLVDHGLFPEIALAVLHPFEVGSCNAPGVGQNVLDHKHSLLGQGIIGH